MIARDPHQRSLYNRRLKMEMDERARLQAALAEGLAAGEAKGLAAGEAKGTVIGRIQLLQSLMGIAETPAENLREQTLTQLAELNNELQRQFQGRGRE
jgi:flagellar biosynthesis/type III secretory pathway protein FliH